MGLRVGEWREDVIWIYAMFVVVTGALIFVVPRRTGAFAVPWSV
jgi:hypothetical protein